MKTWGHFLTLVVLITFSETSINAADKEKPKITVDTNSSVDLQTKALKESVQQSQWVQTLEENLGQKILGISAWQYIAAFLALFIGLVLKRIILNYIQKKITAYVKKTDAEWDDQLFEAIIKPVNPAIIEPVNLAAFNLVLIEVFSEISVDRAAKGRLILV